MKNDAVTFLLFAGILAALTGCNLNSSSDPLSGNMIGYVSLHDVNGYVVQEDTGIWVSVAGKVYTTTTNTDSAGEWEISGLTSGTYDISVSKSGYGTREALDFQFVGVGQANIGTVTLYQIPLDSVTRLSDSVSASDGTVFLSGTLAGTLPTEAGLARVYIFLGGDTAVSFDPQHYLNYTSANNTFTSTTFSTSISNDTMFLLNSGFRTGQTVYTVAYAGSTNPIAYTDSTTNRSVFTGLNPSRSNIDSFVVP